MMEDDTWYLLSLNKPLWPIPAIIGISVLITSLLTSHSLTPYPISQLGKRPAGKGLWTYLLSFLRSGGSNGMWGYDSSLGSFSPVWRLTFHLSACFFLWSCILFTEGEIVTSYLDSNNVNDNDNDNDRHFWFFGGLAVVLYATINFAYWTFTLGVSHPGGPREHKIRRVPQWEYRTTNILDYDANDNIRWRADVAQDSHLVTLERFGLEKEDGENGIKRNEVGMSGEPFGRQIWSCYSDFSRENAVTSLSDELKKTIQKTIGEMASAGREGFNPFINPNSADVPFRTQMISDYVRNGGTLPDTKSDCKTAKEAAKKAVHFYSMLQTKDGHWAGDYGGPHFLMPGIIIAWYVMGRPNLLLDSEQGKLMARYLIVHQQIDGGWGTHIESPSTMFGTVMCYVALRLLGLTADCETMRRGRHFIQVHGGAIMTSSWAKFWLCLLGCMEWEGHNSVPPEMWLLPNWFPFHPGRLWCHCRMVYLPMGYLYGTKFVYENAERDDIILSLRKELYCEDYESISWSKTRNMVAPMDNYSPIPFNMEFSQNCLAMYESLAIFQPLKNFFRKLGLKFCIDYMVAEDLQTNYINIGPVSKALNMLSAFHAANNNVNHYTVKNHMMRVPDYLWVAEDGMKMQGYNGSQCWDTSFAIQAISECHFMDEFPSLSRKVWSYLERTQILSTEISQASPAFHYESLGNRNKYFRHVSKGGWPFSTSAHGWPISDCTGEGLKGVIVLLKSATVQKGISNGTLKNIEDSRLYDAVNVILTLQNEDGGWATYENNRGFRWYEQLNPSEVFGDIMIDYSYVECSMASLTALADFQKLYPTHRSEEIKYAINRGKEFLKSIQRVDGSWYGSWACCFCYGSWFGIEGLVRAGEPVSSNAIQRCCTFLLSHQRKNGGWGEDFTSCYDKDYAVNGMHSYGDEGSGVVNTAWALLALSEAKCADIIAIRRGVKYLMNRQLPSGDWPQEGIAGVFNRACGITYTAYRNIFPIWALGRCIETYGDALQL